MQEFLTNPDILEELMPWNISVQKICKAILVILEPQLGDLLFRGGMLLGGYIVTMANTDNRP